MTLFCFSLAIGRAWSASPAVSSAAQLAALAEVAEFGDSRAARLAAAKEGMRIGDRCVHREPKNPACYYYRAVHTGLYYQLHIFGYQKGLVRMLADCEVVNRSAPKFADAGCYRMIGQIFLQLPQTAFRPGQLVRDLDRARAALDQAIRLAPKSLENQIAMCETALAMDDWVAGRRACSAAEQLLPQHRGSKGFAEWQRLLAAAQAELKRH